MKRFSIPVFLLGVLGLWLLRNADPVLRLGASSLGFLFVVKVCAWLWQEKPRSRLGNVVFIFAWPGVRVEGYLSRHTEPVAETGKRFLEAWLTMIAGVILLLVSSLVGRGESLAWNYVALFSILLIVHLGLMEVLADGLRLLGFQPRSLFDRPWLMTSLRDFWSHRWNRAFVDMNKLFLLKPLRNRGAPGVLVFAIFFVSGILHELGISYPDGVSWGWPMVYFSVQGLGVLIEKKFKLPRLMAWAWIIVPVPLLFTPAFVTLFLGGLGAWIAAFSDSLSRVDFFAAGLKIGALLHFVVLMASVQVPARLAWREEFSRLRPLNRKVVWTYGAYIFSIIVFMGAVSYWLANSQSLDGAAAKLWIVFIALFWWARVLIDTFYMKHEDWPEGALFKVGHVCLGSVFWSMALLYGALAVCLVGGGLE